MNRQQLIHQVQKKQSLLCVGLDTDPQKIPPHLLETEDPIFEFNKAVIEATHEFAVAYKPNIAFYEAEGLKGWKSLEKTIKYLQVEHPDIFSIADAKRGDIGNTSRKYAQAFLSHLNFDSITVAPYMGQDSVKPFLEFKDKWVILLALTSNSGSSDFQTLQVNGKEGLFEAVLYKAQEWGTTENLMFVVGATKVSFLKKIRAIVPKHFLLVPGVGAQGGSLSEVIQYGLDKEQPNLLINSSRGIIYASSGRNFQEEMHARAKSLQREMAGFL